MWDVGDVGCSRCGMFGMWDVRDVGCLGCGMFRMWYVPDVGCSGCGMFGMWVVRDVGCSGCGMLIAHFCKSFKTEIKEFINYEKSTKSPSAESKIRK